MLDAHGSHHGRKSWGGHALSADKEIEGFSRINYDEDREEFYGTFEVAHNCRVLGLDSRSLGMSSQSASVRMGSIAFGTQNTEGYRKYSVLVAHHQIPVDPTVRYTLLLPRINFNEVNGMFAVGVRNAIGEFQKLCVVVIVSQADARMVEKFSGTERVLLM